MNQILTVAIALIFALALWGMGKKPQRIFKLNSKANSFKSYQKEESSIVVKPKLKQLIFTNNFEEENSKPPLTNQERIKLRKKLFKLIKSNPEERLYAVELASKWGHSCILPVIRRGLKDSDSRVMVAAAKGIAKYKQTQKIKTAQYQSSRPRNIFLMR